MAAESFRIKAEYIDALRDRIFKSMASLSETEIQTLLYRFGFVSGKELTLREAGVRMGMTCEAVRLAEERAILKLKQSKQLKEVLE